MTRQKRSKLQLDLKDLNNAQSTPGTHHLVLASFTMIALVAVYILINAPSASTAKTTEAVSISNTIDIFQNQSSSSTASGLVINTPSQLQKIIAPESASPATQKVAPKIGPVAKTDPSLIDVSKFKAPWLIETVSKGDTLSQIFDRNNIGNNHAYRITQLEYAKSLLKIRPGQKIKMKKNADGSLALLHYKLDTFNTLLVQPTGDDYVVEVTTREAEVRLNNAKATIYDSLLGAAKQASVSSNTMYNFIAMFGWQIDFAMDIRTGDQFSIIYEELYLDDKKVGDGDIIAAELVVSGKKLQAIRHIDEDGFVNYFAPDGDGIKGTFLRTPLKFGHVTSNFSNNRLHPIKRIWTAHKGVDYGAPRGTPILTTGDGTIRHAGRNGGYGKSVVIRHGGKYDTVYAHMSGYAKGIRVGVKVKQGDVIGYVGSTGLATGPHLHYEFRIHGVHKNPVTVELPKSEPIDNEYLSQFKQAAGIWVAELDYLNRIPLAQNNSN